MGAILGVVTRLKSRWERSRAGRTAKHFSECGGNQLAGGVAYTALFSLFAALAISFTALLGLMGGNRTLLDAVTGVLNDWLPGLVSTSDSTGLVDPNALIISPALSITGIVSVVLLAWSALAFARGIRAAFVAVGGDGADQEGFAKGLARDLGLAALLGAALLVTTGLEVVTWSSDAALASWPPAAQVTASWGIKILAFLISALADAVVVGFLLGPIARGEDGQRTRRRDVRLAALAAGVAFGIVRLLGVSIVAGAAANPLLAPFAAIITLLAWVNLNARIALGAAAWVSVPPRAAAAG